MAHNLENVNGVYSFVENRKSGIAWHQLGQVFDRPMFVKEALEMSHADYNVEMQPVAALSSEVLALMGEGRDIPADMLLDLIVDNSKATVRTDNGHALGMVSNSYGIVQNADAFKFVDLLCSGELADRDHTPIIETAGVLGKGERVFVTAKFPEPIRLDNAGRDIAEMYVVFTTSHDGSGSVNCIITPVRVVCNNTLNFALENNAGRINYRHTSRVMERLDLTDKENREFAYRTLNAFDLYQKSLKEHFDHLQRIRIAEEEANRIIAEVSMSPESFKAFTADGINSKDITSRSRNLYTSMQEALHDGVGQEYGERGTAMWLLNGITTFYQNEKKFSSEEIKFNSITSGDTAGKVNKAFQRVLAVA